MFVQSAVEVATELKKKRDHIQQEKQQLLQLLEHEKQHILQSLDQEKQRLVKCMNDALAKKDADCMEQVAEATAEAHR